MLCASRLAERSWLARDCCEEVHVVMNLEDYPLAGWNFACCCCPTTAAETSGLVREATGNQLANDLAAMAEEILSEPAP